MTRGSHLLRFALSVTILLSFVMPSHASADEIPMTINGEINCAHPANAITTTCRGETPAPPVNTPKADTSSQTQNNSSSEPMTINGEINCANPANSVTTTCWDKGATAIDCTREAFKTYPVCTGIKPEAVVVYEETKASALPMPETNTVETKTVTKAIPVKKVMVSIKCVKGQTVRIVKAYSPKCPSGFKLKK